MIIIVDLPLSLKKLIKSQLEIDYFEYKINITMYLIN